MDNRNPGIRQQGFPRGLSGHRIPRAMIIALLLPFMVVPRGEGTELLGTRAKPWPELSWVQSEPLTLEMLRGKVVLLRFWTSGCPFCENTAPALNGIWKDYKERGLVVLGFFHPKPPKPVNKEEVRQAARKLGFEFPVAIDAGWKALRTWWLDRERAYTSSSFLVDRKGVIRYVHPGGEFHASAEKDHAACDRSYREIRANIEKLLAEKVEPPPR